MEGKVNYTIVGLFVVLIAAGIVLSIIWLSSGFNFETYKTYKVYMQESVSGLNVDSVVEFNGVKAGSVTSIEIDDHNPQLVILLIKINSEIPVTVGTVAKLQTRGITGVTFLALSDQNSDLTPLRAQPGQPYPVIQTAPSLFFRLDAALTSMTKNFEKISKAIENLLDDQNQRSIKEVLLNMRVASKELGYLLHSTNNTMHVLQNQTLPATYRMFNNLDVMSQNLSELSADLKQNPSMLIRGRTPPRLGPGE